MLIVLDVPLAMLNKPPPGPCALSPFSEGTSLGDNASTLLWARASMPTQANEHEYKRSQSMLAEKAKAELRHDGLMVFHETKTHPPRCAFAQARAQRSLLLKQASQMNFHNNKSEHAIKHTTSTRRQGHKGTITLQVHHGIKMLRLPLARALHQAGSPLLLGRNLMKSSVL